MPWHPYFSKRPNDVWFLSVGVPTKSSHRVEIRRSPQQNQGMQSIKLYLHAISYAMYTVKVLHKEKVSCSLKLPKVKLLLYKRRFLYFSCKSVTYTLIKSFASIKSLVYIVKVAVKVKVLCKVSCKVKYSLLDSRSGWWYWFGYGVVLWAPSLDEAEGLCLTFRDYIESCRQWLSI